MKKHEYVYHRQYGIGEVVSCDAGYTTIRFSGMQEECTKVFQTEDCTKYLHFALNGQFLIIDGELKKYVGTDRIIILPAVIKSIGARAFAGNCTVEIVDFGCHITRVSEEAFEQCRSLKKIIGTYGLKTIGARAFQACDRLVEMRLPETLEKIAGAAFSGCISIREIHIPARIRAIDFETFQSCSALEKVTGLVHVKSIGNDAFLGCTKVNLRFCEDLEVIKQRAFYLCDALHPIVLPKNVVEIGKDAFFQLRLQKVIYGVPNSYVETYAKTNGFIFKDIKNSPPLVHAATPSAPIPKVSTVEKDNKSIPKAQSGEETNIWSAPEAVALATHATTTASTKQSPKTTKNTPGDTLSKFTKKSHNKKKRNALIATCVGLLVVLGTVLGVQHDRVSNIVEGAFVGEVKTHKGLYTGDLDWGALQGLGTMKYNDGTVYTGEWYNNLMHGSGQMKYPDGSVYTGEWYNDVMQGPATVDYISGNMYSGTVDAGLRSGEGSFTWNDGSSYVGNWENDQISGEGVFRYFDGTRYSGTFENGVRSGKGTYTWSNGDVLSGVWEKDRPNGLCHMEKVSGAVYDGVFSNGQLVDGTYTLPKNGYVTALTVKPNEDDLFSIVFDSGREISGIIHENGMTCTISFECGDSFTGNIIDGKKDGSGEYTWYTGEVYTGEWCNDSMEGQGKFTFNDGTSFTGMFSGNAFVNGTIEVPTESATYTYELVNSVLEETVTVALPDGTRYVGTYSENKVTGSGTIFYYDSEVYVGAVKEGKKVGQGKYTWSDKASYDGAWSDDMMNGYGTYYFSDGNTHRLEGYFYNNVPSGTCYYYTSSGTRYVTYWSNGSMTNIYQG